MEQDNIGRHPLALVEEKYCFPVLRHSQLDQQG
jgi:hypothetical protein